MRKGCVFSIAFVCLLSAGTFQAAAQKRALKNFGATAAAADKTSPPPSHPAATARLPISRVVLYSNGMIYVERRGQIAGSAEINLSFKQSQVDDVLKSMVVLDLGRGSRIGAVSYNSSVPAAARTAEIPFNIESSTEDDSGETRGGLAGVLSQLQGAKVLVTSARGAASGAILSVEKRQIVRKTKEGEQETAPAGYWLVIAGDAGVISSFDLEEIRSVKLLDDETRRDVREFADATASARRRDAKTISIAAEGAGQRELIVSYTVSAPIWKTTYRVVLDDDGKPFFQGWAIVDNVGDEDWKGVKLSLVSGSPISFIQPIQNPLYRYRPVVEIPEDLNLEPQVYDPSPGYTVGDKSASGSGIGSGRGYGSGSGNGIGSISETVKVETSISQVLLSETGGVQAAAKGSEFGDLFEYRIEQPVTVLRNRSALIPIVQTRMEGERVSIYNESVKRDRPMSGMLLHNTSSLTLEGGSMTVLDRDAYAGEALMERLKPKEKRLISFAVDLGTLVTVKDEQVREPAKLVKAVNGTFQIHYFRSDRKTYSFTNQTDRVKTIFVEHPVRQNWLLSGDTPKPFDVTQNNYRFRVELQPFETKKLTVNERQPLMDSYKISALTFQDLDMFLTRRYIDEAVEKRLSSLLELRMRISQTEEKIKALDQEEKEISADQKRLRENIEALTKTPEAKQLISRYIAKADEQETRVEAIARERQTLKAERQRLENELAAAISNFNL